ncbi:aldo/keto reductase [Actinopolymorpha sp. B17G11]|uniref:aldo/keto reductase n=1 Tax=Actinopolymorpha sp. B17G11 TaxID=3160861 RepID=UPI0032E51EC1
MTVTRLGLGGAPLGDMRERVDEAQAWATLQAAWDAGVRYFDTAPWYGRGLSEHRFGRFLSRCPRDEFSVSTKVGRVLRPARDPQRFDTAPWVGGLPFEVVFDYTYDGIMRSYEDSLQRLGLARVDALVVHDLDHWFHAPEPRVQAYLDQLVTSGWRALEELRSSGVGAVGVGINEIGMIPRFAALFDVDFFLVAMRYTLADQSAAAEELVLCEERGIDIVVGAPFQSGILVTGPIRGAQYDYAEASPDQLERVGRIADLFSRHRVELAAGALQFPAAHPRVAAVLAGALSPEQVQTNVARASAAIPEVLWSDLRAAGLIRADVPVPQGESAR